MEWIKTILPLIGVALGWFLSERGKIFADKRQDKRKLKKLLFFLLDLRYHFARELANELDLDKYISVVKSKMALKLGVDENDPELNLGLTAWKPILEQLISKTKTQEDKFEYFAENIDKILLELAEIFPILAYELSGRHNIKERLKNADDYFGQFQSMSDEIPFDIKQWVNPMLTKDLLQELDESIEKISRQIDSKTLIDSKDKITKMTFENDEKEMNDIIDDYLEKVIEMLPNQKN